MIVGSTEVDRRRRVPVRDFGSAGPWPRVWQMRHDPGGYPWMHVVAIPPWSLIEGVNVSHLLSSRTWGLGSLVLSVGVARPWRSGYAGLATRQGCRSVRLQVASGG
jgi:hypothetical protein